MERFKEIYGTFLDWLEKPVMFVAALCMGLALLNTALGILSDTVLGSSLAWNEEINTLFFCWTSFLGAGVVARYGGHIGVDTLIAYFPEKLRQAVTWLHTVLALVIVWVMFYYGTKLAFFVGKTQTSLYLDINLTLYYLAIPVGGVILGLNSIGYVLGLYNPADKGH